MLEGNAIKWLGTTKKWGVITGVRLETKNMITKATVKNYGMEIIGNDGNRLKGNWTGGVKTKVRKCLHHLPVLVHIKSTHDCGQSRYICLISDG